jgi:hypothetical protein
MLTFFTSAYFESYTCPDMVWLRIRQKNGTQFCANFVKSITITLLMIRQAIGIERMRFTQIVQNHRNCKRREKWRSKSRACWQFSLTSWGLVTNNSPWQAPTIDSAYYSDVSRWFNENARRLRPELWRWKNWLLHHDNAPYHTSFFTKNFLTKATWLSSPTHPIFLCFHDRRYNWRVPILTQFDRIVGGAEHPRRTWIPGCIK